MEEPFELGGLEGPSRLHWTVVQCVAAGPLPHSLHVSVTLEIAVL